MGKASGVYLPAVPTQEDLHLGLLKCPIPLKTVKIVQHLYTHTYLLCHNFAFFFFFVLSQNRNLHFYQ